MKLTKKKLKHLDNLIKLLEALKTDFSKKHLDYKGLELCFDQKRQEFYCKNSKDQITFILENPRFDYR